VTGVIEKADSFRPRVIQSSYVSAQSNVDITKLSVLHDDDFEAYPLKRFADGRDII
jgi:hypothetical protein